MSDSDYLIASLLSSDLESEDLALKSRDSQISADALLARQLASGSSSSSPSSSPSLVSLATVRILRDAIQTGVVKANKMILDTLRNPMPEGHDDANDAGRALLVERLVHYGLVEKEVTPDGNCQFRAIADQLYSAESMHADVRKKVVAQLVNKRERYAPFVDSDYDEYLARMRKEREWGDGVTLQAASDAYGITISLITSYDEGFYIEVHPDERKVTERSLWLSFFAEVHYNSLYPLNG
mmetsp:Transcript_6846/g.15613  ORF Transcript_6846/g.15613 Transcript_6846/m.15613 type:complete len:239 (-) Transcript_6846:86-802(-)